MCFMLVKVDGGYTGQPFAAAIRDLIGATVQVAKRSELHAFTVIPQHWVVERSFAWLEKCRRFWKNTERLPNTSPQFVTRRFWPCFYEDSEQATIMLLTYSSYLGQYE